MYKRQGLTVKDKAGTTTTSAISKGTITITDKENQKQDIEKLNRNTENSLNKLKEIFDKTKVEERKRLDVYKRQHGETIFESAMSSAINAKIAKYLGRETVIGRCV